MKPHAPTTVNEHERVGSDGVTTCKRVTICARSDDDLDTCHRCHITGHHRLDIGDDELNVLSIRHHKSPRTQYWFDSPNDQATRMNALRSRAIHAVNPQRRHAIHVTGLEGRIHLFIRSNDCR